ncbi:Putative ubiquitin-like-specific protease 1B [Apostasia shenzhenica]|uniref:Ubiquitin-like-specific protease 1B n=1 Tax=Apostasia shenzhenica TaxID=1088818 RepID=A0A2H9ZZ96_9ASPA|nr:Putative ubiquitin-like-specific protease 1B [Apostasia shenzhenica]
MFLGLYRSKLGSYKTFLNAMDNKPQRQVQFVFLPCHIPNSGHWLLLVCDIEMQKWIAYNSLYDPRHREVVKEQRILLAEYLYEDHGFDGRHWSLDYSRRYPQQEPDTLDCGVFVIKFIETIIRIPRKTNFQEADMRLFRA